MCKKIFQINKDKYYLVVCYIIPSIILAVLCVVDFSIASCLSWGETHFNIGSCLLIALGIVLATLTIIAIVASFREISRSKRQEFADALQTKIKDAKEITTQATTHYEKLKEIVKDIEPFSTKIDNYKKQITELENNVQNLNTKVDNLNIDLFKKTLQSISDNVTAIKTKIESEVQSGPGTASPKTGPETTDTEKLTMS